MNLVVRKYFKILYCECKQRKRFKILRAITKYMKAIKLSPLSKRHKKKYVS